MRRQGVKDRFMEKVQVTKDCWIWQATKNWNEYGRFKLSGSLQGVKWYPFHVIERRRNVQLCLSFPDQQCGTVIHGLYRYYPL